MINQKELNQIRGCFEYKGNSWCPVNVQDETECIKEVWTRQ